MTTDLAIRTAITEVILPVQRGDGSTIVRQTTLAADVTGGTDTTVTLSDLTGFGVGSPVSFADTLGERRLYVAEDFDGTNPAPLDFTGYGYDTLQHDHAAGTVVFTNLFNFAPWSIAPILGYGDPVTFAHCLEAPYRQIAMPRGTAGTFTINVQCHRLLNRAGESGGTRMNSNAWAEQQDELLHDDMRRINTALLSNQSLIGPDTEARALQMSPLGSKGEKTVIRYARETINADTTHLYAVLTAVYVGLPEPV